MGLVLRATGFSGGRTEWVAYILAALERSRPLHSGLESIF